MPREVFIPPQCFISNPDSSLLLLIAICFQIMELIVTAGDVCFLSFFFFRVECLFFRRQRRLLSSPKEVGRKTFGAKRWYLKPNRTDWLFFSPFPPYFNGVSKAKVYIFSLGNDVNLVKDWLHGVDEIKSTSNMSVIPLQMTHKSCCQGKKVFNPRHQFSELPSWQFISCR